VVGREAGFALKVLRPGAEDQAAVTPPGQGQLLITLRGEAIIDELGPDDGKVVMTQRAERRQVLPEGHLFKVVNDASWRIFASSGDTVVLAISTSVPREVDRHLDILALARRRLHMAPRQLFANEMLRLEFTAARGLLPFRGWVPYSHRSPKVEYAIGLAGSFAARVEQPEGSHWEGELSHGSLLRVPPTAAHRFRARGRGLCVGLIVSALMVRKEGETIDRREVKGFTPFGRG